MQGRLFKSGRVVCFHSVTLLVLIYSVGSVTSQAMHTCVLFWQVARILSSIF
jgi:hypothetical protein